MIRIIKKAIACLLINECEALNIKLMNNLNLNHDSEKAETRYL